MLSSTHSVLISRSTTVFARLSQASACCRHSASVIVMTFQVSVQLGRSSAVSLATAIELHNFQNSVDRGRRQGSEKIMVGRCQLMHACSDACFGHFLPSAALPDRRSSE